ncbi:MAG: hypothetical protein AAB431_02575, partial [Patescibacteria group bacterium]
LKSFSKLTHIDFSKQSYAYSLNADQSKIIVSQMGVRDGDSFEGMGGPEPAAPSDIYLINTNTDTAARIFIDKDFPISPIVLGPDGTEWGYDIYESGSIWLMSVVDKDRVNQNHFTNGRLLDWLKDGIVVDRNGNDVAYIDRVTHKATVLARNAGSYYDSDFQTVNYIGSITIE